MPSSHYFQLNEIVDIIVLTDPKKLLDIGVGFGKYGFLAREFLELWKEDSDYHSHTVLIDGIEAYEPYITPVHRIIYDHLFIGNAIDILPTLKIKYDLILLVDVFEHFTYEEGITLLEECRKAAGNVLISVPLIMSEQDTVFGNPFETHKYGWKKKDFRHIPDKIFFPNKKSLICFIGDDSLRIKTLIKKRNCRLRMIRILDLLRLKRTVKRLFQWV